MAELAQGKRAPEVKLPLMGGGEFSLTESLAKGAVVLAFFKISCPVCQYSFPLYQKMSDRLAKHGVRVIGVSQDDEKSTAQFAQKLGVKFPIALDNPKGYAVSNAYGLRTVPMVFEIGPSGYVESAIIGWSRAEMEEIYWRYADGRGAGVPVFEEGEVWEYKIG